jgi:hypothetical protein
MINPPTKLQAANDADGVQLRQRGGLLRHKAPPLFLSTIRLKILPVACHENELKVVIVDRYDVTDRESSLKPSIRMPSKASALLN